MEGAVYAWLKHELHEVFITTLFFFVCFAGIAVLKKLYLAELNVDFPAGLRAFVAALVVGKVVVILKKTSFGRRLERRAVYLAVAYRSLIYTSAVALAMLAEKWVHGVIEVGEVGPGLAHAIEHADPHQIAANALAVFFVFCFYNLLEEIDGWLGEGTLRAFVLGGRDV